jgi:hypothetical protein
MMRGRVPELCRWNAVTRRDQSPVGKVVLEPRRLPWCPAAISALTMIC